ncbi:MAG: PD40 domain-containing protein [Bacteroidetes bacterium]|nr:PD40 domain-containing protein [Bacteroidota bacterium]
MKRIFIICLFLLVNLSFVFSQQKFNEEFQNKFTIADNFIAEGNYKGALPVFISLYGLDTTNSNINFNIGVCYINSSYIKTKSIPYLERACQNVNVDYQGNYDELTAPVHAFYYLGIAYRIAYRLDEAIDNFSKFKYYLSPDQIDLINDVDRQIEICYNAKKIMANPLVIKIDNLGSEINTIYPEYSPIISSNDSMVYFTSRRENSTGMLKTPEGKYYEDIYVAKSKGNLLSWNKPEQIGSNINTNGHEATISISADGKQLFIYKDDNGDGNIYLSKNENGVWSVPEKLSSEINTKSWETHASLSPDGITLYFVSNKPGGYGGRDIYKSEKMANGKWSKAQNLGPLINSKYDEDSPFISADGATLYFSSQGHENMGGFDIFTATLNEEGAWTDLENIGYPINTTDDDIFYVPTRDEKHALYSSAKLGGQGDQDLYLITIVEGKKKYAILKGAVFESFSYKPLEAKLVIRDVIKNETIASFHSDKKNGAYSITLPIGGKYEITATADNYIAQTELIETSDKIDVQEINKAILLKKVPKPDQKITINNKEITLGERIVLKNIQFEFNSAKLTAESKTELLQVVNSLKISSSLVVEISGHTDNVGSAAINKGLSEDRAYAVVDFLVENGIAKDRLKAVGYGFERPVASNNTEEGRAKNRRTEFRIIRNY